jgi:hypothetical protein
VLPVFRTELDNFKKNIDSLKSIKETPGSNVIVPFKPAAVSLPKNTEFYMIGEEQQVYTDTVLRIKEFAGELKGLKGIRLSKNKQIEQGTSLTFTTSKPVKVLVGFFNEKYAYNERNTAYLKAPELETDATANEYGQDEIKIGNGLTMGDMPPVNVHAYSFKQGTHTLTLGKGMSLILGFVDGNQNIRIRDAGYGAAEKKDIDWLFE